MKQCNVAHEYQQPGVVPQRRNHLRSLGSSSGHKDRLCLVAVGEPYEESLMPTRVLDDVTVSWFVGRQGSAKRLQLNEPVCGEHPRGTFAPLGADPRPPA